MVASAGDTVLCVQYVSHESRSPVSSPVNTAVAVHMRYMYALLAGLVSSVAVGFASAVVLGITKIYLTGHGIYWPSKEFNWQFISMSLLDLIMVGASILSLLGAFIVALKVQGPGP